MLWFSATEKHRNASLEWKTIMRMLPALLLVLSSSCFANQSILAADEPNSESSFATVNLFFVNQFILESTAEQGDQPGEGGGGFGGMGGVMQFHFETARLFLNDRFVGDTLFRHVDARPKFNLPAGEYKFRVECDGYTNYERTLTVLANGSVQWLVVKLERSAKPDATKAKPSDGSR